MSSTIQVPAPRMKDLFAQTKRMCFGRYAVELPAEAEQIMGFQQIAGGFKQFPVEAFPDAEIFLQEHWKKVLLENRSARPLCPISEGPARNSKFIWYYEDEFDSEDDTRMLDGAIRVGSSVYLYEGMAAKIEHMPPGDVPFAVEPC